MNTKDAISLGVLSWLLILICLMSAGCLSAQVLPTGVLTPSPAAYLPVTVRKAIIETPVAGDTPIQTPTPTATAAQTRTPTRTPAPASTSTPTGTPPLLPVVMPFGVQTFGESRLDVPRSRALEAGVRWMRADVAWGSVEPLPPGDPGHRYDWTALDAIISSMARDGFNPLLTVGGSPQWAVERMPVDSGTGKHYNCGPIDEEDLGAFAAFVRALVERYDGDGTDDGPGVVRYWEFWNEPDGMGPKGMEFSGCWGGYSDTNPDWDGDGLYDAYEYGRMLSVAYPAMKAASGETQLSFGAIAYDRSASVSYFNLNFTNEVLDYLQSQHGSDPSYPYFDAMSFHAYSNPALAYNWSPPNLLGKAVGQGVTNTYNNSSYMAGRPSVRGLLAGRGLDKPLICSEIGRASGVYSGSAQTGVDPPETSEGQSRYVVRGFVQAMTLWPGVMKLGVWFTLVDPASPKPLGLLRAESFEPKSAWYAYQVLAQELDGATYARSLSEAGMEGHVFSLPGGGEETVVWVTPDGQARAGSARQRGFAVGSGQGLRVVRMYEVSAGSDEWRWQRATITDGGSGDLDGSVDGKVTLEITANPQFVR